MADPKDPLNRAIRAKALSHQELAAAILKPLMFKVIGGDYVDSTGELNQLDWITHDRDSVAKVEHELLYGEHFELENVDKVRELYMMMLQMCAGYNTWIVLAEARPRAEAIWCVLEMMKENGIKMNQ